jgi:Glycosyltransferase sugar-binding region containing DXD motif
MKGLHLLIITVIIILLISLLFFFRFKEPYEHTPSTHDTGNLISLTYFNKTFPTCNCSSSSLDSVIVCETLKSVPATPFFYFDNLPKNFYKNGWYFGNSNFSDSPHNIICKTKQSYNILKPKFPNKNIIYTGFTSIDKYNPSIPKNYKKFIHIAGNSASKETLPIFQAWKKHPEWPEILFIWNPVNELIISKLQIIKPCHNIKIIDKYLPHNELDSLMNQYGTHICPSEYTTFGHTINEARSTKATILYSDIPGLNELFPGTPGTCGIPIKAHNSDTIYTTTPEDIEAAVSVCLSMSESELANIGEIARDNFLAGDEQFRKSLVSQVTGFKQIPHTVQFIWISPNTPYEDVDIPEKFQQYIDSWNQNNNSSFTYNLWSGKQILSLISTNFPEFLEFYKNISTISSKCEFSKICILYKHGGVYSDLDFFCKKDISPLLQGESFCMMEDQEYIGNPTEKIILTNFLASYPENPFLYKYISFLTSKNHKDISTFSGPIGLYNYFKSSDDTFLVSNTCLVAPIISTHTHIQKIYRGSSTNESSESSTQKILEDDGFNHDDMPNKDTLSLGTNSEQDTHP